MADACAPQRRLSAHRLHAAGTGQEPLPDPVGGGEPGLLRPAVRATASASERSACDELLARTGLAPFRDRPVAKLSGGMKQKLGLVLRADPRPRSADPRRADHRRRSALAPPVLAADRPLCARAAAGHERARGHRLHGRSRTLRLAGRDGRRSGARRRAPAREHPGPHATRTLEEAFVALLPAGQAADHRRAGHPAARRASDRRRRDRGARSDPALRRLHRRGPRELPDRARRDLRLRRLQRLRQDHDHEDADRPAAAPRRGRHCCSGTPIDATRPRDAAASRLHVAVLLALHRADRAAEPRAARTAVPPAAGAGAGARRARWRAIRAERVPRRAWPRSCRWACASACRSR